MGDSSGMNVHRGVSVFCVGPECTVKCKIAWCVLEPIILMWIVSKFSQGQKERESWDLRGEG